MIIQTQRVISSVNQLGIAKAFLRESQSSKDWLNLLDIAKRYDLDYHECRRFLLKLVRRNYVFTRKIIGSVRPPLDFKFASDGYTRLVQEYLDISKSVGQVTQELK